MRQINQIFVLTIVIIASCNSVPEDVQQAYETIPAQIDFNRHVRPILSDRCYNCHGPDENKREASLRLDQQSGAFGKLPSGNKAFAPNSIGKSAVVERILHKDPEIMMPPPESHLSLTNKEKAILIKWIKQGAKWKKHWAYLPVENPSLPLISESSWEQWNETDHFIQKKLEENNLVPKPLADQSIRLRRIFMDLTGLPPSIEDLDRFLSSNEPTASFEQEVDRLLASEHYGERLAMEWMDVARYADSHGMHADGWRYMHPWRDWVIKAFNANMPFDQMIIEQLAGDLLPNANDDQKLATAFHRNHAMTAEGGVIDEEFRLEYVFDRTNTTATAFLGMTMECARCHDHKFDPIAQKEFYEMAAFFNNIKELGMTGDDGNYGPSLMLLNEDQKLKFQSLQASYDKVQSDLNLLKNEVNQIKEFLDKPLLSSPTIHVPFDWVDQMGKEYLVDRFPKVTASEGVEFITNENRRIAKFENQYDQLFIKGHGQYEIYDPFSISLWINTGKADETKKQTLIGNAGNKNNFWRGWDFYLDEKNRLNVRLIHSLPHNYIHVRSEEAIPVGVWKQVGLAYNGLGKADGIKLYIDGRPVLKIIEFDQLYKSILTVASGDHKPEDRPLRIGQSNRAFTGENGIFIGMLDDLYIFSNQISDLEMNRLFGGHAQEADDKLKHHHAFLNNIKVKSLRNELRSILKNKTILLNDIEEVMVLEEMSIPRTMYILNRGSYEQPLDPVEPGIPKVLGDFPENLPKNRLGLAHWITDDSNPLTARVVVNRYWQMMFGQGLVHTPADFGSQGSLPTHPELLDWLANYFVKSGWDLKALLKKIVTSYTYNQQSGISKIASEKDPLNEYLSCFPKYRYPAEMIRDNALAASGLLVAKIGGKSVKPYQPDGLWIELGNFSHKLLTYKQDSLDDLYRRTLYTFVRRTSPPPALTVFDLPNRDVCKVKRELTQTPLQSLVLLNDPTYVEAARVMAADVLATSENKTEQIIIAFRKLTSRYPDETELSVLLNLYEESAASYAKNPEKADELLVVGEWPYQPSSDKSSHAALSLVINTIINHDDTFQKS